MEEEMYRENKERGMMKEEASLLLFQTLEGIIEDLEEKEREKWKGFLRGFVDEESPRYFYDGCKHSATHAYPQRIPFPTCTAGRMEKKDETIGGAALQLKGMAYGLWFENYISCYHANEESHDGFNKGLVREFDENHCESLCNKNIKHFACIGENHETNSIPYF